MSKKLFYILVVILLGSIALFSWKLMLFIAVIVGIAVLVFGKKNVRDFISGNYKNAKKKLDSAYDRFIKEEHHVIKNIVTKPAEQQKFFKVSVTTEDGKEYSVLLQQGEPIPASIKIDAKIVIARRLAFSEEDGIARKTYIVTGENKFECI